MKRIAAILAAAATLSAGLLVIAPAAQASTYGCSGTELRGFPVWGPNGPLSGIAQGTLYVYYDASTGKNCAVDVATSAGGYGVSKYMHVSIQECAQTATSPTCTRIGPLSYNSGNFLYYAGPVSISAPGHCIDVVAEQNYDNTPAYFDSGAVFCG